MGSPGQLAVTSHSWTKSCRYESTSSKQYGRSQIVCQVSAPCLNRWYWKYVMDDMTKNLGRNESTIKCRYFVLHFKVQFKVLSFMHTAKLLLLNRMSWPWITETAINLFFRNTKQNIFDLITDYVHTSMADITLKKLCITRMFVVQNFLLSWTSFDGY